MALSFRLAIEIEEVETTSRWRSLAAAKDAPVAEQPMRTAIVDCRRAPWHVLVDCSTVEFTVDQRPSNIESRLTDTKRTFDTQ